MIGLDSNILAYALDPTFPEHRHAKKAILELDSWHINPTVVHEVYHTLVFKRKMEPTAAERKLIEFLGDERTFFANQTKSTSLFSLSLASKFGLGGRDSLTIGCYLHAKVSKMLTHDEEILQLKALKFRGRGVEFTDPIK
ncbi:MAG: PIN domain-containing protein [Candidatus Hodarchaeaceae archaeon]|nr:PIN domain-containing protein [Candidatus Hodarchaeaceae archaeon]